MICLCPSWTSWNQCKTSPNLFNHTESHPFHAYGPNILRYWKFHRRRQHQKERKGTKLELRKATIRVARSSTRGVRICNIIFLFVSLFRSPRPPAGNGSRSAPVCEWMRAWELLPKEKMLFFEQFSITFATTFHPL